MFERLPRLGRLGESARAVARELVEWREQTRALGGPAVGLRDSRPRADRARAASAVGPAGLEQIRGLPAQTLHRRGDQLLKAIERGRERARPAGAARPGSREPADAPLVSLAQALVRHRSMESDVAVELVATQAELAA